MRASGSDRPLLLTYFFNAKPPVISHCFPS